MEEKKPIVGNIDDMTAMGQSIHIKVIVPAMFGNRIHLGPIELKEVE